MEIHINTPSHPANGSDARAAATSVATVTDIGFDSLGLRPELLQAVAEAGYTRTTPIQARAIPVVLTGRDLLAAAQTGTGKTAGFTLPILEHLSTAKPAHPPKQGGPKSARWPVRVLVLVPTRELAAQVEESVRTYGKHLGAIRSTTIFGGVGMQGQIHALERGADIVVATPGRLLDHLSQKTIDLGRVEILVLDEADRMLDMGFIHDIRRILALLPAKRQNLMFSATFSPDIRKLAQSFLHDPATVEVARSGTPAELVAQRVYHVDAGRKRELLAHLIESGDWQQVLVFTRTKHGANRLAQQLGKAGIESDAIHGNKAQNARTRALGDFKAGKVRVLVATDIAARGLDIEALPHVVNFDLPNVAEDYVHRIGRTGRAGASGEAVSLVCADDRANLKAIEKLIGRAIAVAPVPAGLPAMTEVAPVATREARGRGGERRAEGREADRGMRGRPKQPMKSPSQTPVKKSHSKPLGKPATGQSGAAVRTPPAPQPSRDRRAPRQPSRDGAPRRDSRPPHREERDSRVRASLPLSGPQLQPRLRGPVTAARPQPSQAVETRAIAARAPAPRQQPVAAPAPQPAPAAPETPKRRGFRQAIAALLGGRDDR